MQIKKTHKKKAKQKKSFNMYTAVHKNKKTLVMIICSILVITLIAGVFAQFAYL